MVPGVAVAVVLLLPMLFLAGLYLFESPHWRVGCLVALGLWLAVTTAAPIVMREWSWLMFPGAITLFWLFLSEIRRAFKD